MRRLIAAGGKTLDKADEHTIYTDQVTTFRQRTSRTPRERQ
ncbi:hypothetical protein AVDCRST_MAG92-4914 [uncultured Coleofasciculus sp.]|uniref:Uncharacterized protein n=1 Tax=uncultured Coleofasciculus sp. TaxID=1267456 RepID=A0A6J4K8D5_9CYAN|nr:hypothetical protein AVDCRST_MAG92-4914 [uncultured Coleofasciculus sp.]